MAYFYATTEMRDAGWPVRVPELLCGNFTIGPMTNWERSDCHCLSEWVRRLFPPNLYGPVRAALAQAHEDVNTEVGRENREARHFAIKKNLPIPVPAAGTGLHHERADKRVTTSEVAAVWSHAMRELGY